MPLDTSIYGQIQPVAPPTNPLLQIGQIAQLRNNQVQADAQQRALELQNRRNGVLASPEFQSADTAKRQNLLYGVGDVAGATQVGTASAAANKDNREAAKTQLEMHLKTLEAAANIAGTVTDQASYDRALPMMQSLGFDTSKFSPQYNPDGVAQFAQATLSQKDRLDALYKQQQIQTTQRGQDMTAQTAAAGQAVTIRGQNMTDARAQDANRIASDNKASAGTTSLRKEFQDLPEVKNYVQALPAFEAIKDAATRNTPMSDINLVYGVAKLYDPTSVVREGEYATVANAPAIPERIKGWASYIAGGGKLTDETKRQILEEANGRMATFQTALEGKRSQYKDIAERSGVDPTLVLDQGYKPPTNRGSGAPAAAKPATGMTRKTIGGVTYENDGKGWYKVQ